MRPRRRIDPLRADLGQYITAEEAAERYTNLQEWYRRYGHFWVNTGPFFLQRAFPVEGTIIMQRNPDYPDPATSGMPSLRRLSPRWWWMVPAV